MKRLTAETCYQSAAERAQNCAALKGGTRADVWLRRTELQKDKLLLWLMLLTSCSISSAVCAVKTAAQSASLREHIGTAPQICPTH